MSFDLVYGGQGLWYGRFSSLPSDLVTQAVTARQGGVSKGCYASLNPALHNGDELADVLANRKLIAAALGFADNRFVTADQVHGDNVYRVTESDIGRGAYSQAEAIQNTDALITDCRNVPLMMFFADCVPVLLVDSVKRAIGICHAGWRGTVAKIPFKTVQRMTAEFGSRPQDILAAVAPSIGPCCYEVDSAVEQQVRSAFGAKADELLQRSAADKWLLDLWQANRQSLLEAGLLADNIELSGVCTSCNSQLFYSYRADKGRTGRLAVIMALK